ncbi:hypothetical protein D3C71_1224450 [compost metagenome]
MYDNVSDARSAASIGKRIFHAGCGRAGASAYQDSSPGQRGHRRQRGRAARGHGASRWPATRGYGAPGAQGRARGPGRRRCGRALQRGGRFRGQGTAARKLDQRARDHHARGAHLAGPARVYADRAAAAARGLHIRGLPQCRRYGGHPQHTGHQHHGAVRAGRGRARGRAHPPGTPAALPQRGRRRGAGTHLRLRRRDRRARRGHSDPHAAQHRPQPEFRRHLHGGQPGLRETAA